MSIFLEELVLLLQDFDLLLRLVIFTNIDLSSVLHDCICKIYYYFVFQFYLRIFRLYFNVISNICYLKHWFTVLSVYTVYCIDIIDRNLEIEILTLKLRHFEPGVKMKNETLPDFCFSPIIEIILQLLCYTFAIYYWNSES